MTSLDATRPCSMNAPPTVRLVVDEGEQVCPDCEGALVVIDLTDKSPA